MRGGAERLACASGGVSGSEMGRGGGGRKWEVEGIGIGTDPSLMLLVFAVFFCLSVPVADNALL
jgi:hypothetical protein